MVFIERNGKEKRSLTHKNEKCVGCGICTDICPTDSIKLGPILPIARGLIETDFININKDMCCLCGLCAFSCPFGALELNINDVDAKKLDNYPRWMHDALIDEDACIYCGRCEKVCPRDAIYVNAIMPSRADLVIGEAEIDRDKCIYCGMCEEMCPANAISINTKEVSSNSPEIADGISIDKSKCMYCGICKRICPEDAIKIICTTCMLRDEIKEPEIEGSIVLDNEKCINCGWCQEICPKDAAIITKPFDGEIFVKEDITCKGESCHACADVCPCNAISIVENKSYINPKLCTLCGACTKACPQSGIVIKRKKMNLKNVRSKAWKTKLANLME